MKTEDSQKNKRRKIYALVFMLLMITEIIIALFVHDSFIRPYAGDIIVTVVLYYFIRIFVPDGIKGLPVYIFAVAFITEIMQYYDIISILGFGENRFLKILFGSTFDVKDIVCYAVGCVITAVLQYVRYRKPVITDDN